MLNKAASTLLRQSVRSGLRVLPSSVGALGSVRNLNVHEHISMELFNENGITTPGGAVAFTPQEAKQAFQKMGNRKF